MIKNKIEVKITDTEIQKLSKGNREDAFLQIIANSVDADASEVKIYLRYEEQGINSEEMSTKVLSEIVVSDNGYGIDSERVDEYFSQYGTSWKKDRIRANGRGYNGNKGTGRFKYLTIGKSIYWETTHKKDDSNFSYSLMLKYDSPRNIPITKPRSSTDPIGTQVTISQLSDKGLELTPEIIEHTIVQGFGLYIKNSLGKFKIYLNDEEVALDKYIDDSKKETFSLKICDVIYDFRCEFIAWNKELEFKRHKHTFLYDDKGNYKDMIPSGIHASNYLPYHTVFVFSDYYTKYDSYSDGFHDVSGRVRQGYREKLTQFLFGVKRKRSWKEYETFKDKDFYPFSSNLSDDVTKAESSVFDLCAFLILESDPKLLINKNHSLILLFKLLKKFVEKDENIADNLLEIINLDEQHAAQFRSACKSTKLPDLIVHYNELQRRETFLDVLDTLVHEDFYKTHLKERTQLHKILEKELWVFGEDLDYNLGTSDQRLTEVLKKNLQNRELSSEEIAEIEKEINDKKEDVDNCLKKIPDLYLWRKYENSQEKTVKNIVIELKAPKVKLSPPLIKQGEKIYKGVLSATGVEISDRNQWRYIYISSDITSTLEDKYQGAPELQVISDYKNGNYIISCKKWSQIIQDARFKLKEIKKGLKIQISEEQKNDLLNSYLNGVGFLT